MLNLSIALLMAPNQAANAGEIVSKTLAKYAEAQSVAGDITMTQTAQGKKVVIESKLQAEKPNKLFLQQSSEQVAPNKWLAVCNGAKLVYDTPNMSSKVIQRGRLEDLTTFIDKADGSPKVMKHNDLFRAIKLSLGDPINPFLEFTLQSAESKDTLKAFVQRLKGLKLGEAKKLEDGTEVSTVVGFIQFGQKDLVERGIQVNEDYNAMGKIEFLVTKDFDLRQVKINEQLSITIPDSNVPVQVNVVTIWAGKIEVNGTIDQKLFNP